MALFHLADGGDEPFPFLEIRYDGVRPLVVRIDF